MPESMEMAPAPGLSNSLASGPVPSKGARPAGVLRLDGRPRRLLIACHRLNPTGGLLRFERAGMVLDAWGHEVAFVPLGDAPSTPVPEAFRLPVLSPEEAADRHWDAVMVPGAGFPGSTTARLARFRDDRFGVRVQHVLNGPVRRDAFKAVNDAIAPHVVLFNNRHWPEGSFDDFSGDRFHVLIGAVDLLRFRPRSYRSHPINGERWAIGGQANKNPGPLIEALGGLPAGVVLRLFGKDEYDLAHTQEDLIARGRLELAGFRFGDDLARFYREVDCVAMTETFAGWSNLVAEAMASGVPVVCTSQGTLDLARHGETALVVEQPTAEAVASAILRLKQDATLCRNLADRALDVIRPYSWESYARNLLKLIQLDNRQNVLAQGQDVRLRQEGAGLPPSDPAHGEPSRPMIEAAPEARTANQTRGARNP